MKINFIKYKKFSFILSGIAAIITLLIVFVGGVRFGIDFTGGTIMELHAQKDIDATKINQILKSKNLNNLMVQNVDGNILIKTNENNVDLIKRALTYPDSQYIKIESIGPQMTSKLIINSFIAVCCGLLSVFTYLLFRFNFKFGITGIIALVHDIVITFGFISVTHIEINTTIIVALLTIVGYSINDSVVIFDRIREKLRSRSNETIDQIVNLSINSTLSRTVITSATTLLAILPLIIFDRGTVREFSIVVFFGVLIGTYSSIFIASLLLTNEK